MREFSYFQYPETGAKAWATNTFGDSRGGDHFQLLDEDGEDRQIWKITFYRGQVEEGTVITGIEAMWDSSTSAFAGRRTDDYKTVEFPNHVRIEGITVTSGYFIDAVEFKWFEGTGLAEWDFGGPGGTRGIVEIPRVQNTHDDKLFYWPDPVVVGIVGYAGNNIDRIAFIMKYVLSRFSRYFSPGHLIKKLTGNNSFRDRKGGKDK